MKTLIHELEQLLPADVFANGRSKQRVQLKRTYVNDRYRGTLYYLRIHWSTPEALSLVGDS